MNKIKFKIGNKRYVVLLTLIFSCFCVFAFRLVDWQIINKEYYRMRANSSNVYFVKTDAIRGEIFDADGTSLAINDNGYKLVIDRLTIEKGKENELILKSIDLLEKLGNTWVDILPIGVKSGSFFFLDDQESQVKAMKKTFELSAEAAAQECMDKMVAKYKLTDFSRKEQRKLCSVKYNMDKIGIYNTKSVPYILADGIKKEAVIIFSEKAQELQGTRVQTSLMRKYINSALAPHIVGYTGFMSGEEYEKRKEKYSMDATIGKTGIESVCEDDLKGTGGKRMVQMSRSGAVIDVSDKEPASPGNSVFLTLSSKLQEAANKSLQENIENARKKGASDCTSGAAVVLNVKDFSILAASTYPSYDLDKFMNEQDYYSQLAGDAAVPLLNRAFFGAFAPGSIYKPLVACAALEEGKINSEETIRCGGSYNYYSGYRLRCMGVHGNIKLINAIARSCNVYFAELGRRLGAELLGNWAKRFGMGIKTGVEVGESKGILAGPQHCADVGAHWYESGSSQAAIGQSDNMITPLQLATYTATIASGGNRFKTHIIKKITDYTKAKVIKEYQPVLEEKLNISEENLKLVKEGMREVVLSGTARDFASYPVAVAGKTGTAQNAGSDHTTFICFAPYDNPEIAISVVVANGKYGSASKNVAKDIMNSYFNIQK